MSTDYFVMKPTMNNSVAVKANEGLALACCVDGVAVKSSAIFITLCIVFSCCSILISPIQCISLSPVYWNLSNPMFKSSRNVHIISVNPFDEIDFVCPFYSVQQQQQQTSTDVSTTTTSGSQSANTEFYLIYQVSKSEYNECSIFSENSARLILSCNQPKHRRRFTIWFDPFQSVPKVPEYKSGHSYYFITPSTGQQSGLTNLYQGACFHHNMKLTIHIRDFISNEDDGPGHQPPSDYVSSRDVIGDAAENRRPTDADDVSHHHHHHPRRHQQQQQQHPVLHQNNRSLPSSSSSSSSSSSVYSRRNLSRHLPVMNSSQSSPLPPPPPPLTSAATDALQDKALAHLQTHLQVKDTNRQLQPTQHLRISQEQPKKSVFKSKQEGLTVGSSSSSTASLLSAHFTHGFQVLFNFGCYLCCVTVVVVHVLSQRFSCILLY